MGKDLGKKKKGIQGKRDKKRAYGVGRTLVSMLGQENSAERVPAVWEWLHVNVLYFSSEVRGPCCLLEGLAKG